VPRKFGAIQYGKIQVYLTLCGCAVNGELINMCLKLVV